MPIVRFCQTTPDDSAGFTLTELLVVVSIILTLTTAALMSYNGTYERAQSAQIVADFQEMKAAWEFFHADTKQPFPLESSYSGTNPQTPCMSEPMLQNTDVLTNASGFPGWAGPYLSPEPVDPWGRRYNYDNDGNVYDFTAGPKAAGINAVLQWCEEADGTRYRRVADTIDKIVDKSDGDSAGSFRWDTTDPGSFYFLIAPQN